MAEDGKPKSKKENELLRGVDPVIEKKVDKMMNPETAPLIPDEKLPDFDKTAGKQTPNPAKSELPEVNKTLSIQEAVEKYQTKVSTSDPETDKAVDDILAEESDRMLAIEDAKAELLAEGTAEIDKGFLSRLKSGFSKFWHNPKARLGVFAVIFLAIAAVAVIPTSRYFALNTFGVRASTSLKVVDEKTSQPLKNVEVSIDGKSAKTDKQGKVKLEKIKLGNQQLSVKKPAFAEVNQEVIIGWGSNPRGDVRLAPVGSRYLFVVKDFVSDKPAKAEASSGEASATTNENGEIALVMPDQEEQIVQIQITGDSYRTETVELEVGDKSLHEIKMVPAKKQAFVSKRSGKYDLYKIDVDGKNEEKVLTGTGNESEDRLAILPHSKKDIVAYVSPRGEQRTQNGFIMGTLMLINLSDNQAVSIDNSERIQLVNFIGNKLVYVKIAEGESAESSTRHRLIAYDIETEQEKELANANYFNDVTSVENNIFYAPSAFQSGDIGLFRINADGNNKTTIYSEEAWNLFRVAYDRIDVSVGQQWYEYNTVTTQFNSLAGPPATMKSRVYADSPDAEKSAWVDERDGKGVLVIYDIDSKEEKVLHTQSGLRNPIAWLDNDHLVYRVSTSSETADYVISLSGGEPKKIKDVTNTAGLDRWYYY